MPFFIVVGRDRLHFSGPVHELVGFDSPIFCFFWQDPSNTASWIYHISVSTRDDMDVGVRNCLACCHAVVDSDVECIGLVFSFQNFTDFGDNQPQFPQFLKSCTISLLPSGEIAQRLPSAKLKPSNDPIREHAWREEAVKSVTSGKVGGLKL
jgi:hypothetical protein